MLRKVLLCHSIVEESIFFPGYLLFDFDRRIVLCSLINIEIGTMEFKLNSLERESFTYL